MENTQEEERHEEKEEVGKDQLTLPSPEVLRQIATTQDAREQDNAAKLIQKTYRGYRARRALQGYGLDSSTRWMDVLKEATYYNSIKPVSRHDREISSPSPASMTRDRWARAATVMQRAGSDDTSSEGAIDDADEEREHRRQQKKEREEYARTMGLEYFLEMVDTKHRYGSNLRRYHAEWKKADTHENFFYWLDHGEGKDLDLEDRPRSRLDTECVRYLSREERQKYLVGINDEGLFCWAKNNMPITTSPDFKDSIDGIVSVDDPTSTWREVTTGVAPEPSPPGSRSSSFSGISTGSQEDASKYVNSELKEAKGIAKIKHVNVDTLMNHMLRKTTKKNTWIYVADTSFRLYIGIKQSGAFQHSSFLRGARVSSAGLIKIKRGQLRKLSPLSGHYSPPVKNFREFVKALKEEGADLSRVSFSRSYAVLLGLEGYIGAKQHVKSAEQGVRDMVDPEGKRKRIEAAEDKSQSARREREILEQQELERRKNSVSHRIMRKLGLEEGVKKGGTQQGEAHS